MAVAWSRTDDLDGSPDAAQITFGFGGSAYTIDLASKNADKLQKALQPFLTVAYEYGELPSAPEGALVPEVVSTNNVSPLLTSSRRRRRAPRTKVQESAPAPTTEPVQRTIRQWANENGYQVSSRGRIPDAVMEAYTAAH